MDATDEREPAGQGEPQAKADAGRGLAQKWVRAVLFFLLGFLLLAEPLMLILLLYKNGTLQW